MNEVIRLISIGIRIQSQKGEEQKKGGQDMTQYELLRACIYQLTVVFSSLGMLENVYNN